MSAPAASPAQQQRTFLGHPLGLYVLFFTEMWERFSYYGMRALLMLYMLNYFRMVQKDASTIYKVYTSFVYVTPIIGGFLADRYLGNKRAVIIGAVAMAIGHFLMAFEETYIFYAALIFLMIGNGFFKPNMSTQVGRLYPANDGRRDGAYTIFYMGINLGAFLSPLVCGWLAENTVGSYHTGFTMAGIGMVCGLVIYLVGQPLVREIAVTPAPPQGGPNDEPDGDPGEIAGTTAAHEEMKAGKAPAALTEARAEKTPSSLGPIAGVIPFILYGLGGLLILYAAIRMLLLLAPADWGLSPMEIWDSIMVAMGGVCLLLIGFVASQVRGGMRDRVVTILVLGIFVVFFWGAFEQAGNVLNVWADKHTDRYLTKTAPPADPVPTVVEDEPKADGSESGRGQVGLLQRFVTMWNLKPPPTGKPTPGWGEWLTKSFNPVPTAWFQSINALAIFVLAPVFAFGWVVLDKRGWQPSIPMKMFIGLVMMSASVAIMIAAAKQENQASATLVQDDKLPAAIAVNDAGEVGFINAKGETERFQAGRLSYDASAKTLHMVGVLPDNERDRLLEATAPASFRKKVEELQQLSKAEGVDFAKSSVEVKLEEVPPRFDMKYSGLKKSVVEYRSADQTLIAKQKLADKEVKGLLVAASEPGFRDTLNGLYVESNNFRVSWSWLFWSYILATVGELCLSPVGLSMVSKLAPARYGTMLMGVWMLTSAFGNFAAGTLGEIWGTIPPVQFFLYTTLVVAAAALVLLVLVRMIVRMMHGVQ